MFKGKASYCKAGADADTYATGYSQRMNILKPGNCIYREHARK